jgi:hypothetical protein
MSTPIVTEITRRLEPVVHDTFIDDLAPESPNGRPSDVRKEHAE